MAVRIVVSGYHGMGNTGDEAVLEAFLQGLRRLAPDASVTVLSGDPEATRRAYGVDAVQRTHLPSIFRALRGADLLVSGGGSLLQDVTGRLTVPYYTGVMAIARVLRVPVAVYAQGLGPLNSGLARWLVRVALNRAKVVSLRDAESVELLREVGVDRADVSLVADPAFALAPEDSAVARRVENREGVVLFALRPWDVGRDITEEYAQCARRIRIELGAEVVFVAFQPSADMALAERLAKLSGATTVAFDMTPGQALGVVAKAQLVVGMRLHSLIFAASAGVPAVAIEYDPKVRALCERVGTRHVLPADVDGDVLYETIARAWSIRERLHAEQALSVDELREGARMATEQVLRPVTGDGRASAGRRVGAGGRGRGRECERGQVLGVAVDLVSPDEAAARCDDMVRSGSGGHVVTINPEIILACEKDEGLMQAVSGAHLVVPDGIGVVLGLRILGNKVPGRVPGIELAEALMSQAAEAGRSVFLVGAKPGVAEEAGRRMSLKLPGLKIAGVRHGYFSCDEESGVLEAIRGAGPSYVFVGLGAGKQEKWIAQVRAACAPGAVWVGIGGSFDVMAGVLKRAPGAWQRLGLEWAYRLIQEPSRLKRMTALPVFAARVAVSAITGRDRTQRQH